MILIRCFDFTLNCLQLHLLKTWNETFYLFIFMMRLLRLFHQDEIKTQTHKRQCWRNYSFWVPIKSSLVLLCIPLLLLLFVCLHAIPEYFLFCFFNVLVSLNITLSKYLVFSVSVWFHWMVFDIPGFSSDVDTPLKINFRETSAT